MPQFLFVRDGQIFDGDKPVILKGVNVGGWLMMEAYIMGSPNFPERKFKKEFAKALGARALQDFEEDFRSTWIQESDFKNIKNLGFNCIRVPFHYRVVELRPYEYQSAGLKYLDQAVAWAEKYGLYIILDLHAAPGSQNHDWHGDSDGNARLWSVKSFRKRTAALWKFLAKRYCHSTAVAGYDLLNESVTEDIAGLNELYEDVIKAIRQVDQNHILFIEGNKWATDVGCLNRFNDHNYAVSFHTYEPLDFTFNFVPGLHYAQASSKKKLRDHHIQYYNFSTSRRVPMYIGEFGVNARQGLFDEQGWVMDNMALFKEFGFHWAYWTYKAIKYSAFPDGIYSYYQNPSWVNRMGPVTGWDTFSRLWPHHRTQIVESWKTKHFGINKEILEALTRP